MAVKNYRDNATPSEIVSGGFGTEVISVTTAGVQASDQQCREVYVWPASGDSVRIGETAVIANAGPILPANAIRIPISNTNKLFFDAAGNVTVNVLWRT